MLEIAPADIANRLRTDNPWWQEPIDHSSPPMSWPRRAYYHALLELIRQPVQRAVILMGARRVGKTTLLHQLIGDATANGEFGEVMFASIDAPTFNGMRLESFISLSETIKPHSSTKPRLIIFDEVQYLPDGERHLKDLVDRFPATRFIASGSAGAALKRKSLESGAGRFTDFELPPLNFAEFLDFSQVTDEVIEADTPNGQIAVKDFDRLNALFIDYLNVGGYPEIVRNKTAQTNMGRFVKTDIVEKVLLRDLPSLYGISNIPELNKLFTTVAYNTGQLVSLEGLSQNSGITKPTITRYLDYLEAAFLITRLRRVDVTAKRLTRERNFKVYLTNPSMRAALFGPVDANSSALGALAETAVVTQYIHSEVFRELAFANWAKGEVDIVRINPATQQPFWALDVKWSDRAQGLSDEWAPLLEFCQRNSLTQAWMTSKTVNAKSRRWDVECTTIPIAQFAFLVGSYAATPGNLLSRYGLANAGDSELPLPDEI